MVYDDIAVVDTDIWLLATIAARLMNTKLFHLGLDWEVYCELCAFLYEKRLKRIDTLKLVCPRVMGMRTEPLNKSTITMACEIVDRHLKNIDNVFLYLDEIFYYI
jgi:hypothetical protein